MYFSLRNCAAALTISASLLVLAGCDASGGPKSSGGTQDTGNQIPAPRPRPVPALPRSISGASGTPQTLSGDTNRANNSTFVLGESVELSFQANGLAASRTTSLAVNVSDEFGNEISSTSLSMTADSSGKASAAFAAPASQFGYYRVEAMLPNGTTLASLGTRPAGFITYAVVPDPANRINYGDAGSRFGMQGGFSGAQGSVLSYLGIRYLLNGPGWSDLEPDHMDQFAEARSAALAKGPAPIADNTAAWSTYAIPLLTQTSVPAWAMEPGTGTKSFPAMGVLNSSGVEGLPLFANARASEVAADYASQSAHYYQVTWEPEIPAGFGGTPEQLVQFYQLSYEAIH